MEEDARLYLQIRNSIDNEVIGLINHCKFVKELMYYLEFLYSGKENVSRIFEVCKAFHQPEKQDRSLTTHFMEFKKTYEEPFSADIKEPASTPTIALAELGKPDTCLMSSSSN